MAQPPMQAAPQGGSMMGGIGSMVVGGMAFGAGSEIAHQAVRGIMGTGSSHGNQQEAPQQQQQQTQQPPQQYQQDPNQMAYGQPAY